MMNKDCSDLKGGVVVVANILSDDFCSPVNDAIEQENLLNHILQVVSKLSLDDALIPFLPGKKYWQRY